MDRKQTMKATTIAVRQMRPMSWADFKHKLCRAGVIATPAADVPTEWQEAFRKVFRK